MEVLSEMSLTADLEHVRDVEEIAKYNVKGTPALIINGKVICSGRIPSKNIIRKWLEETGFQKMLRRKNGQTSTYKKHSLLRTP